MSEITADPGPEQQYLAALARGQFQIQHCADCGKYVFYPRALCPHCGGTHLSWVRPTGLGTVCSVTIVRGAPHPATGSHLPQAAATAPPFAGAPADGGDYNVVMVDLEEGVRVLSKVVGIANAEIEVGMRVHAEVIQEEGKPVLVFMTNRRPQ